MKRTKQVFHREGDEVPKFVSGLRQFDGEDIRKLLCLSYFELLSCFLLDYAERMKENADR